MVHQFLRGFSKMKNKYYKTCEICGANLDPNEICTCLQDAKEEKECADINKKVSATVKLLSVGKRGKNARINKTKIRGT